MTHDGSTQTRPLADDAARGMPRLPLWAASLTIETGLLHMIACNAFAVNEFHLDRHNPRVPSPKLGAGEGRC